MKRLVLLAMSAVACTPLSGDDSSFTVVVRDEAGPVADAIVILEVEEDGDDEVCGTTDADGVADISWSSCQTSWFTCHNHVFGVRVSKTGYDAARYDTGFSTSARAEIRLSACADTCDEAPETCDEDAIADRARRHPPTF